MKLLSIGIPSYNSEAYLDQCMKSLLIGDERLEIIIVNDGSKDKTKAIAESYEKKCPTIVKAISQENGGHGQAVNTGFKNSTGLYYKVVDSDDWVNPDSLKLILDTIEENLQKNIDVDMYISNFIYDKVGITNKKTMHYTGLLPEQKIFNWSEVEKFPITKYILMHSVIYSAALLKKIDLQLPKHTFYVDNIFVYKPLPSVKNMYYINTDLYHYFIGREDQSVNEKVHISRFDQQIKVNKIMYDDVDLTKLDNASLRNYMYRYLSSVTAITSILAIRSKSNELMNKKQNMLYHFQEHNPKQYAVLKKKTLFKLTNTKTKISKAATVFIYKLANKIFNYN